MKWVVSIIRAIVVIGIGLFSLGTILIGSALASIHGIDEWSDRTRL